MAYPSTLDTTSTIPVESANTPLSTNHITSHSAIQTAIIAIETLLGVTASAVTGTFNYILGEITGSDKAVGKTATQTLENKTLGAGTAIDLGSDAEGDIYYRNSSGDLARLARGTDNYILKMNGNVPNWETETTVVAATESTEGISRLATAAQITSGAATESGYPLVVTPDQLALSTPVFNGSSLTGLNKTKIATTFETAARFTSTTSGLTGNANTFNTDGVLLARAFTYGASYNNLTFKVNMKASTLYLGNPVFTTRINLTDTTNTVFSTYFGLGNPTAASTGHTYTVGHTGFKIIKTGGVISLYATQANGSSETASSALTTLSSGDDVDLILQVNSTTSVDYWYRVNGGALSSATNLTTNMPSGTSNTAQFSMSSDNVDNGIVQITVNGASYER